MTRWARRSCAAALVATLAPGLAAPASAASAAPAPARRAPLSVVASSLVKQASASAVQERALAPAQPAEETPKSFWKSPKGIVTGILLAGGLGWVIYSKSRDRVRSPANP
jgi:hypothetical protein